MCACARVCVAFTDEIDVFHHHHMNVSIICCHAQVGAAMHAWGVRGMYFTIHEKVYFGAFRG